MQQIKCLVLELDVDLSLDDYQRGRNWLWTRFLEQEGSEAMTAKAVELVTRYPQLRHAKDHKGRTALELAPQDLKDKIMSLFSWHGR